jgi:enamine deaminase RidA (YjgF/YER057c/UK114 family)
MTSTNTSHHQHANREVLHVQCMSLWAPMCIGPYSQANLVFNSLLFVAGQIPLDPQVMELLPVASFDRSLILCMRHLARIISVYGSKLQDVLSCVIYIPSSSLQYSDSDRIIQLVRKLLSINCNEQIYDEDADRAAHAYDRDIHSVYPDHMLGDDDADDQMNSAFEAYPVIIIPVISLPRNAPVEVEFIGMTAPLPSSLALTTIESREIIHHSIDDGTISTKRFGLSVPSQAWPFWSKHQLSSPQSADSGILDKSDDSHIQGLMSRPHTVEIDSYDEPIEFRFAARYYDYCLLSGFIELHLVDESAATSAQFPSADILGRRLSYLLKKLFVVSKLSLHQHLRYLRLFYSLAQLSHTQAFLIRQAIESSLFDEYGGSSVDLPLILIPSPSSPGSSAILKLQYLGIDGLQLQSERWIYDT